MIPGDPFFWFCVALAGALAAFAIIISTSGPPPRLRPPRRKAVAPPPPTEEAKPEVPPPMPVPVPPPQPPRAEELPKVPRVRWSARFRAYLRELFPVHRPRRVEVKPAREPLAVRLVSGRRFTHSMAVDLAQRIRDYIPKAALQISPYKFAAEHVFWMLASLPAAIVAPALALLVHPLFLLLLALPPLMFILPYLRLKMAVGDHKRAVDAELPFFTVHAAVSQSAGLNIYESLCSTIGKRVFREIEKAAAIVKRNFKILGMSVIDAVEKLGREHPHPGMRTLLLGYTSEFRSGGDVTRYLESKADEHLRLTRSKYEKYTRDVGIIMELILSALLIVPTMLVTAIVLAPGEALLLGSIFIAIAVPAIIAGCFMLLRTSQPKDYTTYSGLPLPLVLIAIPILVIALRAFALWTALGVGIGVLLLLYGLPIVFQRAEVSAHEKSLSQFLRDVTEYQKIGHPIPRAIMNLRDRPAYTAAFRDLLDYVSMQLRMGRRLSEVKVPSRSWLTQLAFFHLGQVAETGGLSPRSTELLTEFITRVKETRDEVRSTVGIHRFIAFSVPIVLAFIGAAMIGALQAFSVIQIPQAPGVQLPMLATAVSPIMYEIIYAIILVSSISVLFLSSYATDFTPKNTVWAAVGAFLSAAVIAGIPIIANWILKLVGMI
jgi:flagellar protein FlaJ